MSANPTGAGKRRAETPKKSMFRRGGGRPAPTGGRRADREEEREGMTSEYLQALRDTEHDDLGWGYDTSTSLRPVAAPRSGPGIRDVLAGIESELGQDATYQQAVSSLNPRAQGRRVRDY